MSDRWGSKALTAAGALAAVFSSGLVLLVGGTPYAQTETPAAAPPGSIATTDVPFFADWVTSPHAHRASEAFTHWNQEGAVPAECAKCHSTPGFQDFLGADGSAAGTVERPAPIGTVITCAACHNSRTRAFTSVVFPSGLKVDNLGADARCMACHQGRESSASVTRAISGMDDDTPNPRLAFLNVHYRAAGATLMGKAAGGAYEYPGKSYAGRLQHREPYDRCTGCHDPHATAVKVVDCSACHKEVTDKASLHAIRTSKVDYDGNGDANEGIAQEVEHLRSQLYGAITAYAKTVAKKDIVYNADAFPYFFIDTNSNGTADKEEIRPANKFDVWTPRLLKAAYNYQFVTKDPGAFAHNPTYTLQILYDSLADLGAKASVDVSRAKRP
jgi:hypothetical protein